MLGVIARRIELIGRAMPRIRWKLVVHEAGELASKTLVVPIDVRDPRCRLLIREDPGSVRPARSVVQQCGSWAVRTLEDLTDEQWKTIVDMNLTVHFDARRRHSRS